MSFIYDRSLASKIGSILLTDFNSTIKQPSTNKSQRKSVSKCISFTEWVLSFKKQN